MPPERRCMIHTACIPISRSSQQKINIVATCFLIAFGTIANDRSREYFAQPTDAAKSANTATTTTTTTSSPNDEKSEPEPLHWGPLIVIDAATNIVLFLYCFIREELQLMLKENPPRNIPNEFANNRYRRYKAAVYRWLYPHLLKWYPILLPIEAGLVYFGVNVYIPVFGSGFTRGPIWSESVGRALIAACSSFYAVSIKNEPEDPVLRVGFHLGLGAATITLPNVAEEVFACMRTGNIRDLCRNLLICIIITFIRTILVFLASITTEKMGPKAAKPKAAGPAVALASSGVVDMSALNNAGGVADAADANVPLVGGASTSNM